jgi:hypothetical protein
VTKPHSAEYELHAHQGNAVLREEIKEARGNQHPNPQYNTVANLRARFRSRFWEGLSYLTWKKKKIRAILGGTGFFYCRADFPTIAAAPH